MVLTIGPKAGGVASATLVFLHGLGDSGRGWLPAMQEVASALPTLRIILPDAPMTPVTLNGGMRMPSWYDIVDLQPTGDLAAHHHDLAGMHASRQRIQQLMDESASSSTSSTPHNWIVGGFSQGAVVALLAALRDRRITAVACLSGYAPFAKASDISLAERALPLSMWFGHGTDDVVVKFQWGQRSFQLLQGALGPAAVSMQWHQYPGMGHSLCPQELRDLIAFLREQVAIPMRQDL